MLHRLSALTLIVAFGLGLTAPARANDLEKYLPENAGLYVHVNVNRFLTSEVVRKSIPMAVNKFGDDIVPLLQLAKAIDPTIEIPEEEIKQTIQELKKPETIANAFDAIKDFVTDVVLAGDPDQEDKFLVLVKGPKEINEETVDAISTLAGAFGEIKIEKHKQARGIIFEVRMPAPQDQALFIAVPEPGVVCFSLQKDWVEKALAGAKGGLNEKLKPLVAKRTPQDFLFIAMAGSKDPGGVISGFGSLVLEKDISGTLSFTYGAEDKAREAVKEFNDSLTLFADTVKDVLGDKADEVKPVLEKMQASVTGTTVTGQFIVPGTVIEKLLAK